MNCYTKKYKSKKHRSIAFKNAGQLKHNNTKHHNVSNWETYSERVEKRHPRKRAA